MKKDFLNDLFELKNHIQAGRLLTALDYINRLIGRVAVAPEKEIDDTMEKEVER